MKVSKAISVKGVKKIPCLLITSYCLLGGFASSAHASLSFNFNYLPSVDGHGFDDSIYGVERQSALNSAAGMIAAYFVNYTANLTYDVTSYSANDNTLASASSDQLLVPGSFQTSVVQQKILTNGAEDGNNNGADGYIDWNFYSTNNWGLTDNPDSTQYDFKSTAMHELLHSFGFLSDIGAGGIGLGGLSPGKKDTWATFDQFLTDASGVSLIGPDGVFKSSKVSALTAGTLDAPGVLFNGPNAKAANGGQGIPIYTPNPWEEGSSLSHLDSESSLTNLSIMNPAAHNLGLDVRALGPVELAILKDIGFTQVAAIPLPAGAWLMLVGLLTLLGLNRQRMLGT